MTAAAGATSDPFSDRGITALAILKVNYDHEQSFLGNYLPFLYHCLAVSDADVVSSPDLQESLQQEFGIQVPQAVLRRLLARGRNDGKVVEESGVYRIDREALSGCRLDDVRNDVQRGYRQLRETLRHYASEEFRVEWDEANADQLLTRYIDGFSSRVLAAAVAGKPLPRMAETQSSDEYVVHRFVAHIHEQDRSLFDFLETVVKGRMLADALFFELEGREPGGRLDGVEVYFDGPMLLHFLGYAGPEVQAPVLELTELLTRQGAILRCFTHSTTEAKEILDAAASRVWAGQATERFYGDVVAHLVRSGKTRSDIDLMSERLERDLLKHRIQTVATPPHSRALQPDEERLEAILQNRINYTNPTARTRDIDSLTAVHRLRQGRTFRDLSHCVAVFVTRNYDLFRVSAQFFERGRGRVIPQCVHDTSFTVLVWLLEPVSAPDLPRERIIADAYAALNPGDRLWDAYNEEIDRLRESGTLSDNDVQVLRFADEAQRSLMDITKGDPNVFTEGTLAQVLERSREAARAEVQSALQNEQTSHRQLNAEVRRSRERLATVSADAGRWIAAGLFWLLILALTLGAVLGPVGPIDAEIVPTPVQFVCAVFALGAGIWNIAHHGSLSAIRTRLDRRASKWVEAALLRLLRPPQPSQEASPIQDAYQGESKEDESGQAE